MGGPPALTSPTSNPSLSQRVRGARLALQLHWGPGFGGPAEAAAGEGLAGVWAAGRLAQVLALTPSSGALIPELVSSAGEWQIAHSPPELYYQSIGRREVKSQVTARILLRGHTQDQDYGRDQVSGVRCRLWIHLSGSLQPLVCDPG